MVFKSRRCVPAKWCSAKSPAWKAQSRSAPSKSLTARLRFVHTLSSVAGVAHRIFEKLAEHFLFAEQTPFPRRGAVYSRYVATRRLPWSRGWDRRRGWAFTSPGKKKVIIPPRIDFHSEAQMNDAQMDSRSALSRRVYRDIERGTAVRGIIYVIDARLFFPL